MQCRHQSDQIQQCRPRRRERQEELHGCLRRLAELLPRAHVSASFTTEMKRKLGVGKQITVDVGISSDAFVLTARL